jgi:hypothetical protein
LAALVMANGLLVTLDAQPPSQLARQPAAAGQASIYQRYAPIDLTGTWVAVVTEDWAVRMIAPAKGDFESLPLTKAAQDLASKADMAQVDAAGRACEAYGAPAIMREPGRVRISWQDGNTLRIETDAGQQTRLLRFNAADMPRGQPSLQGFSAAEWQYANGFDPLRVPAAGRGGGNRGGGARGGADRGGFGRNPAATEPMGGRLKVVTTNLKAGFLRKNGVPYSADAVVTEYYNLLTEPSGTRWFVVTTMVRDPANLVVDFITSTNFRKEPDGSRWKPQPCWVR